MELTDDELGFLRDILSVYEDDNGQYQFDERWKPLLLKLFGVETLHPRTPSRFLS
jgi:hypothetical protein